MGSQTKIQWADHTFNPWRGCTQISPGCANCYADAQSKRNPSVLGIWGPNGTRVVAAESKWKEVEKWNTNCEFAYNMAHAQWIQEQELTPGNSDPEPQPHEFREKVFCASLADVFEDWDGPMVHADGSVARCSDENRSLWIPPRSGSWADAADLTMNDVRARLFRLIDRCPNLDFLLVTKRPENIRKFWPKSGFPDAGVPGTLGRYEYRHNVWLLTSISDQATADAAVPELLKCRDLCPVLGVSAEPLLGPIEFDRLWLPDRSGWINAFNGRLTCKAAACNAQEFWAETEQAITGKLSWVIVGGESGPNARPCRVEWIRSIVDQCKRAGVPCFVKQLGEFAYGPENDQPHRFNHGRERAAHGDLPATESRLILADRKGGDWDEWPADVRVREFPR